MCEIHNLTVALALVSLNLLKKDCSKK